jgi:sugar phosphate isomerase/epimerase
MNSFGLASTAFGSQRLMARDIAAMRAAGFDTLDLVAAAGHLEIADVALLDEIARSGREAGVTVRSLSVAFDQLQTATPIAVDRGWPLLIGRIGPCRLHQSSADTSAAVAPTLERLTPLLPERGMSLAVQAPGGASLGAEAIITALDAIDDARLGLCLDAGHAHLSGGAAESAEIMSGLIMVSLLHDNNGREDFHRPPGEGAINWPAFLTACWKTGFEGPWIIDVASEAGRTDVVARSVRARARLQAILEDLAQPMTFTE